MFGGSVKTIDTIKKLLLSLSRQRGKEDFLKCSVKNNEIGCYCYTSK